MADTTQSLATEKEARDVAEVDDFLVRKERQELPDDREPADPGIEHAERPGVVRRRHEITSTPRRSAVRRVSGVLRASGEIARPP